MLASILDTNNYDQNKTLSFQSYSEAMALVQRSNFRNIAKTFVPIKSLMFALRFYRSSLSDPMNWNIIIPKYGNIIIILLIVILTIFHATDNTITRCETTRLSVTEHLNIGISKDFQPEIFFICKLFC